MENGIVNATLYPTRHMLSKNQDWTVNCPIFQNHQWIKQSFKIFFILLTEIIARPIFFIKEYSMPQTVWNTENVSKWTSNGQLLSLTASTYWIIYPWLTSNPKISIWVHERAKIHSFSKCQNSDHFWGCEKSILQIQPDHNETFL